MDKLFQQLPLIYRVCRTQETAKMSLEKTVYGLKLSDKKDGRPGLHYFEAKQMDKAFLPDNNCLQNTSHSA